MKTIDRLRAWIDFQGVSFYAFDEKIGAGNGYTSRQMRNKGSVGSDVLEKIFDAYPDLNPTWLLTGKGEMQAKSPDEKGQQAAERAGKRQITHAGTGDIVQQNVQTPSKVRGKSVDFTPQYNMGTPHIITVNNSGIDNIIHVPVKARAGYLSGYADPDFIDTLPTYQLPGFNNRTYRSFEIEGASMSPTLKTRDWVVAEWVESLDDIRDGRVYVVVSKTEGVVVKRLVNRLSERGRLYLKSDNITNKNDYPTIEMNPEDVLEIWYARVYFSADFSEPSEVYRRLNDVEISILELKQQMAHHLPRKN